MAKATTSRPSRASNKNKPAAAGPSVNERILNGMRATADAVREMIAPLFGKIEQRLDTTDQQLTDFGSRLAAIEADPTSPDDLRKQLVQEQGPQWAKLLK